MVAAAAQRETMDAATRKVSEEQLLDVLYEVLAQGTDPTKKLTRAEVESFLHAHARSRKPISEMLAFFAEHELPLEASLYAADPDLGQLASGIHRERGPVAPLFAVEAEPPVARAEERETLADTPTNRNKLSALAAPMPVVPAMPAAPQKSWADARALRYAAVALCCVLVGAFALSMRRSNELARELSAARLQQQATDSALTALEQRAETLRAEVARREAEQATLDQRFHAFVEDQAKEQAAEESALKHLLGARYDTLRMKALAHESATTAQK